MNISHVLPEFPNFKHIELQDKASYQRLFSRFDAYSDCHFNNMFLWFNLYNDFQYAQLGSSIVYKYSEPFEHNISTMRYTVLGDENTDELIDRVLEYAKATDNIEELSMVPGVVIDNLKNPEKYTALEDRDNFDYILDARMIAHLHGRQMRSLREDCNSFIRKNGSDVIIKDFKLNSSHVGMLVNNLHTWDSVYQKTENDSYRHEAIVLNKLFRYVDNLDYYCMCIYIADRLEAFVLYYYTPQKEYVMATSIKNSYRYQDLYDFCVFAYANRASNIETRYINFEQDLGVPGLRRYKESLKPAFFLKRYTVSKT